MILGTCLTTLRTWSADDLPDCNGQTANGLEDCGNPRGCNPASNAGGGSCAGNTVVSRQYAQECVVGTASEYCEEQDDQICTETFHCVEDEDAIDPFNADCVPGTAVTVNGEPIYSEADNVLLYTSCNEVE
jgi:hypothetical protein